MVISDDRRATIECPKGGRRAVTLRSEVPAATNCRDSTAGRAILRLASWLRRSARASCGTCAQWLDRASELLEKISQF